MIIFVLIVKIIIMPQDPPKKKKSAVRASQPLAESPKPSAKDLATDSLIARTRKQDEALFRRLNSKGEQIRIREAGKSSRRKATKPKHI